MTAPRSRSLVGDLVVVALVALVWARHLPAGFVYDDLALIAGNPRVTGGASWGAALTGSFWGFESAAAEGAVGYWRPLTVAVLRATWALAAVPIAFHLVALAMHAGAACVARRLASAWLGSARLGLVCAALFAVHPLQVEPVAWAAALSDGLVGLASLVALLAVTSARQGVRGQLGIAGGAFLLALLAKEQALFLVPVFALVWRLPLRAEGAGEATGARSLATTLGLVLAGYLVLRGVVFGDWLAGFDRANSELGLGVWRGLVFRLEAFGTFICMFVLVELPNPFRPVAPGVPWSDPGFWAALAACVVWGVAAWCARRSRLAQLAVWSLPVTFAAVLLVPNNAGQFPISDRYAYLAVLFFAVGAVAFLERALGASRAVQAGGAAAVLCALIATLNVGRWHDEVALFESAVELNPRDPFAHWSLGRALLSEYRATGEREQLDRAHLHFLVSRGTGRVGYQPSLWQDGELSFAARAAGYRAWLGSAPAVDDGTVWRGANDALQALLGQAYCELELDLLAGRAPAAAQALFAAATERFPTDARAPLGLANAFLAEAQQLASSARAQRLAQAHDALARATARNPALPELAELKARLAIADGDWPAARHALGALAPPRPDLWIEAAREATNRGEARVATELLAALDGTPLAAGDAAELRYVQAVALAQDGEPAAARAALDALLAVEPGHLGARLTRAQLETAAGDYAAAEASYRAATEQHPGSFEAWLGFATLAKENGSPALGAALVGAYAVSPPGDNRRALAAELLVAPAPVDLTRAIEAAEALGEARDASDFARRRAE